jgi:predicted DNA-binding transcriptional regulator AlpA
LTLRLGGGTSVKLGTATRSEGDRSTQGKGAAMSHQQIPDHGLRIFVAPKQVRDVVGLSRSQCDTMERQGRFPRKVTLSAGRKAWILTELRAWADERIRTSRNPK